jgi:quinol-cytochrome oxidoreductase complex cytochrome b subunit
MFAIFLFAIVFSGGLTFAGSLLVVQLLFPELDRRALRRARRVVLLLTAVLVPVIYVAYRKSLPPGEPLVLAAIPALWVATALAAILCALTLAIARRKVGL